MPYTNETVKAGLEELGRIRRRLRSRLNMIPYMPPAMVVYHDQYSGIDQYISDRGRAQKILQYLEYEGCVAHSQVVVPKTATITQLGLVHDFAYLSRLNEHDVGERIFGQGLTDEALRICVEQQRMMVGGTIRAARMAVSHSYPKRILQIGGGFHHAYPEGGYAFCVFNDVAVAISHLRSHGFLAKILIIDLDLHQGDGTKKIFARDPSVVTYSIHAETWNKDDAIGNVDVALGPGFGDSGYLEALRSTLPNVIHKEQPELVFYLAGVDVAEDDELGDWRISHEAIFERLKKPIESNNERLVRVMKHLSRSLAIHDLTAGDDDDIFGDFFQPMKRSRLFDFYSKYGVECALEATGILAHLRKIGYPSPHLEFELDHPNGQAIRLYGEEEKENLLIECILDEKRCLNHLKMLWIEWLLLQNPKKSPPPDRPLLPGQTHPGLGCLPKVIGLLFMVCDRLKFDAIGFNPAHYHVCFLAKGQGSFETASDEARFRIAQNLTAGLNLQKASQCLDDGLICEGNIFKWTPARMLIPTSPAVEAYFDDIAYQNEVEKAAAAEMRKYGKWRPWIGDRN